MRGVINLRERLITPTSQDESQLESVCRKEFECIVERAKCGILLTHDGIRVRVFSDRFDHAFRTAQDWCANPSAKDKLDRERLVRVRWIEPVVGGCVARSACWLVKGANNRGRPENRMYLVWDENYVVWLDPTKDGAWRFSSAYRARDTLIRNYTRNGEEIWRRKE